MRACLCDRGHIAKELQTVATRPGPQLRPNGQTRSLSSCLESVGLSFGQVDADDALGGCGVWAASEPFGVLVVVRLVNVVAALPALCPCPTVNLCGGE